MYQLAETVAPTIAGLDVEAVKQHCRIYSSDDDTYIKDYVVPTVVRMAQEFTRRQLAPATYRLDLDTFPGICKTIRLPRPPLTAVSSITYVDGAGASQTLSSDNYSVVTDIEPGEVRLDHSETWPTVRRQNAAVSVAYTCGYTAGNVPASITMAMLLQARDLYDNRGDIIIGTINSTLPQAKHLLESYIVGDDFENWELCQDRYSTC